MPFPENLQRRLEYFVAQFEFFEPGAKSFDYMTKDTVKVAGVPLSSFSEDGKDGTLDIGIQTEKWHFCARPDDHYCLCESDGLFSGTQ